MNGWRVASRQFRKEQKGQHVVRSKELGLTWLYEIIEKYGSWVLIYKSIRLSIDNSLS
jgi:hypothetical protein